jgi:hypothetical protein
VEVSRESKREFQYSGSSARYDNSQVAIINDESDDMWLRDGSGNPSVKLGNDFNRYDFTRVVTETRVKESDPGKITAGGAMTLNANVVNNDKSRIMPAVRSAAPSGCSTTPKSRASAPSPTVVPPSTSTTSRKRPRRAGRFQHRLLSRRGAGHRRRRDPPAQQQPVLGEHQPGHGLPGAE